MTAPADLAPRPYRDWQPTLTDAITDFFAWWDDPEDDDL